MKKSLLLVVGLGLAVSCTKEVPYQYEAKNEVLSKGSIIREGNEEFLYTVSTGAMSRLTADGRPFSFGDNKRVRLEFTRTGLRVIEKDTDARYQTATNDKLLIEFPIESIDYRCAKDAFGECTGKEEVNNDINELQKSKFKFKINEPFKLAAIEYVPVLFDVQLGSPCYKEIASEITGYEVSDDAINIQVKKDFQQLCLRLENGLSDTSVSSVFHYSLVRVKSVLSKDFKRIPYDHSDEDTFGFFYTSKDLHDVDGNLSDKETVRTMNHWNPNRTNIDYHLSDEFKKPEHAELKALTYEAVRRLNEGLQESGAKFQITLHEPSGKQPGDVRNSMIVLVEDPTAAGLLGYGPQTEDPVTGEIISARTIMFLAGFEQYVRINYDEIGRVMKRAQTAALTKALQKEEQKTDDNLATDDGTGLTADSRIKGTSIKVDAALASKIRSLNWAQKVTKARTQKTPAINPANSGLGEMKTTAQLRRETLDYTRNRNDEYAKRDLKSYMKYLREAKNCEFTSEGAGLPELRPGLIEKIKTKFSTADKKGLRPWATLEKAEKKELISIVMAEVWIPVVLHEMGHNMGLRHNFKGSEDTANFYDAKNADDRAKLQKYGVEHQMPYSTIMEYGDDLRALTFLGKYDIAALRYGYARKVEVVSGGQVKLESLEGEVNAQGVTTISIKSLKEKLGANVKLKEYGFCTDEMVGPNAGCRRFDEGKTLPEIAQYLINSYKDRYQARALRNNRISFSVMDDGDYLDARINNLNDLRIFFELYDRIASMRPYPESSPLWGTDEFLIEVKAAAKLSAEFMLEILNTPELHCLVKNKTTGALAAVVPIGDIGGGLTCMGIDLTAPYEVVGQTGKLFNSTKDPESTNSYIDQIDVRGFYLDRIAAARVMFKRNMSPYSSHDDSLTNFWDRNLVRAQVEQTLQALLTNHVVRPQTFTMADGSELKVMVPLDFHTPGLIKKPLYGFIAEDIGIRNSAVYFSEVLGEEATRSALTSTDNMITGRELKNFVSVRIVGEMDDAPNGSAGFLNIGLGDGRSAYAGGSNIVAQELIIDLELVRGLDGATPAVLGKLVEVLTKKLQAQTPAAPATITEAELGASVPGITAVHAKYVVHLVDLVSMNGALGKIEQLDNGNMLPEAEIVKILDSIPRI